MLDGVAGRPWYHRFDLEEFAASDRRFEVRVGANTFDSEGVTLDLPQLRGRISYATPLQPWPVTLREPGIMGWYGLVPFMECFHGVVSFGHDLNGTLQVEGEQVAFGGGATDASLVASVAIIPWLRGSFRGSIVGLRHGGRLHRWTTYNRSRERSLVIDDDRVRWSMEGPDGRLELEAERVRGGLLHAPLRTAMHQRVEETLDARVIIRHTDAAGRVLLEGVGACAGLEVFGDTARLLALR